MYDLTLLPFKLRQYYMAEILLQICIWESHWIPSLMVILSTLFGGPDACWTTYVQERNRLLPLLWVSSGRNLRMQVKFALIGFDFFIVAIISVIGSIYKYLASIALRLGWSIPYWEHLLWWPMWLHFCWRDMAFRGAIKRWQGKNIVWNKLDIQASYIYVVWYISAQ